MCSLREIDLRILLVEDDALLGDGVCAGLRREGDSVDWVKNGETAILAVNETSYDCVILDIGLPRMSGMDVLRKLRGSQNDVPVLFLTARDQVADRVQGLDAGADDYLVKPFEFAELRARLRALTRRGRGAASELVRYADIEIDTAAHTVSYQGDPVDLSRREFDLLVEIK